MGQRVGRWLAPLDLVERVVDLDRPRDATTPAATAAERCQPARQWTYVRRALVEPRVDLLDRGVEAAGGSPP